MALLSRESVSKAKVVDARTVVITGIDLHIYVITVPRCRAVASAPCLHNGICNRQGFERCTR